MSTSLHPLVTHQRQIHLDFHTSPLIPDLLKDFDARTFAKTMKAAHVNSVTVFSKCHHGMCYYPTKAGVEHPALKGRDMLGETIEALHREGIRCPIYTTMAWEADIALKKPEWRMMRKNGLFADWEHGHPGQWKFLNWMHPDYQDYIEAHLQEVLDGYDVDGVFFDICFFPKGACWSDPCRKIREKNNWLNDGIDTHEYFQAYCQAALSKKFNKIVQAKHPQATTFFNAGADCFMTPDAGVRPRYKNMTHFEVESLPSGFWGYYHFPRLARTVFTWDKPWLGMTGRFQKMWGDFGGLKPQAALEYECFRSQSLGGANSVGDQLPPRGVLDPAAYQLIGAVYEQCEKAEPFYEGSKPFVQVGVVTPSYPGLDCDTSAKSEEGVVQMCEESHYECAVLDGVSDYKPYAVLILTDTTVVSPEVKVKLKAYYDKGGKLIISYRAGFDAAGKWALDFLPLSFHGEVEKFPSFWRAQASFWPKAAKSDRVFYTQGMNALGGKGTSVLIERVLPYFNRTDVTYSSHCQTPPLAKADKFPAAIGGKNFVYFADPIFREYRQAGNTTARDGWLLAMKHLIGEAPFGAGLPTTVTCSPRRRNKDLILTLLHYVPVRKSLDIDVCEERMSFAGEALSCPKQVSAVYVYETGESLQRNVSGAFLLPMVKGRLLLEIPNYFK